MKGVNKGKEVRQKKRGEGNRRKKTENRKEMRID